MKRPLYQQARAIHRSLGTFRAARYLFKRGVPLFSAKILLGFPVRECDVLPGGSLSPLEISNES